VPTLRTSGSVRAWGRETPATRSWHQHINLFNNNLVPAVGAVDSTRRNGSWWSPFRSGSWNLSFL